MEEFYIDVELSQGLTRIQVDEVPSEQWDMAFAPQFIIEYHNGKEFITMTLQLEQGQWYDRDARAAEGNHPQYIDLSREAVHNYYSPLSEIAIRAIGQAIGRHMVVYLTAYMGLFISVFRKPTLN
jgi:hypothetical protein